jgi:hypothetical protein
MSSMPNPMALSAHASRPKGMARRLNTRHGHDQETDEGGGDQISDEPVMGHAVEVIDGRPTTAPLGVLCGAIFATSSLFVTARHDRCPEPAEAAPALLLPHI